MNNWQVTAVIKEAPHLTIEGNQAIWNFTAVHTPVAFDREGRKISGKPLWISCTWTNPKGYEIQELTARSLVKMKGAVTYRTYTRRDGSIGNSVGIEIEAAEKVRQFGLKSLTGPSEGADPDPEKDS